MVRVNQEDKLKWLFKKIKGMFKEITLFFGILFYTCRSYSVGDDAKF